MSQPEKVLPQATGFYWARERGFRYWNLIVEVVGDSPFFRLDVWSLNSPKKATADVDVDLIEEFGPKIADEPPIIEGFREDWR